MVEKTRWRSLKLRLYDDERCRLRLLLFVWKKLLRLLILLFKAVGDVFIVYVGVIQVGETMVCKNAGKVGAVVVGETVSALFCCEKCIFWGHFFRCNVLTTFTF